MNERRIERVARAMANHIYGNDELWLTYIPEAEAAVRALSNCLTPEYDSTRDQKREDLYVELD